MFLPADDYPFTALLEASSAAVQAELRSAHPAGFEPWVVKDAYQGEWTVYGLYHHDPCWVLAESCRRNRPTCPLTSELIDRIPGLLVAGFSRLAPGTHIYPHTDHNGDDTIRCHLALELSEHAAIRINGDVRHWEVGRCLAFQNTGVHEVYNAGPGDRTVLLLDVDGTRAREPLALTSASGSE